MADYIRVAYDESVRPRTDYPLKLCRHLYDWFGMKPGSRLLEAGCGRGEFLAGFKSLGLEAYGADLSQEAQSHVPDIPVKVCDFESAGILYPEGFFDVVYSKSLLEHMHKPERYMAEAFRVLKPGGLLLTLVPDWESNYKVYFDDHTHRTPFARPALLDIYKQSDFVDVEVTLFRQLPVVWRFPILNLFCDAIGPFIPFRTEISFLKWSKLLMLVGSGRKP
ncbi:MAG: class I SAM-dependent methyltransferase [Elusimicrobiota bacterium]